MIQRESEARAGSDHLVPIKLAGLGNTSSTR